MHQSRLVSERWSLEGLAELLDFLNEEKIPLDVATARLRKHEKSCGDCKKTVREILNDTVVHDAT